MLPRQLPDDASVFLPVPGGAVFNTAIALGRLGVSTGFFSGLSTDALGQKLTSALTEAKVKTDLCLYSDRPTTLAFVQLVAGQARYTFYDNQSAGRMLCIDDLPFLSADVTALHLGAISLIAEPCGSAYEALAQRESAKRVISLDPNIRPNFITDAKAHRARIKRLIAISDIVKVSDEDLAWIEPDKSPDAAIENWLAQGVAIVVMTKGAEGAAAYTAHHNLDMPAQKVQVVDTIGAGDSFDAGFLAGLAQQSLLTKSTLKGITHEALGEALHMALSVAAITVSRAGANPPWREELSR